MNEIIKKFWAMEISFKSPLHIGKGSSEEFMGAAQIVQNGAGEYVIPGTSLAGCFFSTMQDCVEMVGNEELWKNLIADEDEKTSKASRLVFRTAVITPEHNVIRDKVRINRKTKTAADGAKFAQWEIMPRDITIMMELDNMSRMGSLNDEQCADIDKWIKAVLWSWHTEGFFIGGKSGSGNGYAILKSARSCELKKDNFDTYLSSSYQDLPKADMGWIECKFPASPENNKAFIKRFRITIGVSYQNPLLIKGGVCYISDTNPVTDAAFIHRNQKPFIPGSSIRGAISSFMDKYGKKEWKELLGQGETSDKENQHGGYAIFTDLLMQKVGKLVQIERHAEDQFSRAIFGSGKFDEERLFDAEFSGELIILKGMTITRAVLDELMEFLKSGFMLDVISLGSGACHPRITMEEKS